MNRKTISQYALRLPNSLKSELEKKAKENKRSLNAEIVSILEAYIGNYDNGSGIQRISTTGSTYSVKDAICEFIRITPGISGALLSVRPGELNKSALTIVIYHNGKKTIFDTCSLTAERRPREWEVYEVCNALDSLEVFANTRFVTERVRATQNMSPSDAIDYLERFSSQLIEKKSVYRFLSLFSYTDNTSQIPTHLFINNWEHLFGLALD